MPERSDALRRWTGLGLLCLVGVIASTGQTLVSVLLQPIKADLGFSDGTIGLVTGIAISIVGGFAAFPIAAAADRHGRRGVLAASIVAWSLAALGMGLATSSIVFSAGVIFFNLGDAALLPLLYAMVPALFDDGRRHRANAILVATLTACAFGVFAVGGLLLEAASRIEGLAIAPWRTVFIVVAVMGLVLVPALALLPPSASPSKALTREEAGWDAYARFLRKDGRVALMVIGGLSIAYAGWLTASFWAPAMLQRRYGVPTAEAGISLGWTLALASLIGIAVAAPVLRRFTATRGDAACLRLMAAGACAAALAALALPIATDAGTFIGALAVMAFAMSFLFTAAPLVLQTSSPERFRSRTIAFFPLLALGIRALALPIIGYFSDSRGGDGHALVSAVTALLIVCLPLAAVIFLRMEDRYRRYLSIDHGGR